MKTSKLVLAVSAGLLFSGCNTLYSKKDYLIKDSSEITKTNTNYEKYWQNEETQKRIREHLKLIKRSGWAAEVK